MPNYFLSNYGGELWVALAGFFLVFGISSLSAENAIEIERIFRLALLVIRRCIGITTTVVVADRYICSVQASLIFPSPAKIHCPQQGGWPKMSFGRWLDDVLRLIRTGLFSRYMSPRKVEVSF